jgi:hypothetical protein
MIFTSAIEAIDHVREEISIDDGCVATDLVRRGLVIPAEHPGHYLLRDIDLQ